MALLMVQYLSGGKWGLLVRRPLEAMSRSLPLAFLYFLPVGIFVKQLYLWAMYPDAEDALKKGLINSVQAHAISYKKPMLNVTSFWVVSLICFAIWAFYIWRAEQVVAAARPGGRPRASSRERQQRAVLAEAL